MKVLILTDLQNDFLPGGPLAVPKGDEILPLANHLQHKFDRVMATLDWHPPNHVSFASNHPGKKPGDIISLNKTKQILWPDHCVQGTHGAELSPDVNRERIEKIFHKGTDPQIDSYSAFFDNEHRKSTGLAEYLREIRAQEIYLAGLATEYCVKYSALDAKHLGFETCVIEDACRGIELQEGDVARALKEMKKAGVYLLNSEALA